MVVLRILACTLYMVAFLPLAGQAQAVENEAAANVENLVKTLDANIRSLRELMGQIENAEFVDRQALVLRQDGRSFQLLADADALAQAVAELPEGSPVRAQVTEKLIDDLRDTGDKIFLRLEELDQHIAKSTAELESLGAAARIATEAFLQTLESVRFQYYEALINHNESRKLLGLSFADSKKRLTRAIRLQAEALTGQVEFSNSAREEIQRRLNQDPDSADLALAEANLTTSHGESVEHLSLAADLLDRLEVDTAEYRTVLLRQSTGVSVSMLQSGVLEQLFSDGLERARELALEHSPDLLLNLLIFLLVLFVFRWLSRLTRRVVRASCDRSTLGLSVLLTDILVSASGGTVMILGVLMALSQVGISLAPMLAGLGVAGFVIGFALQDTLGNFAAGAMILIYRPYDVDDFVEVTGASGLVKKMSLVSTTIVTFDNQTLVIPNSKIWGDVIKNVTAQKVRRVDMEFGIGYSDDIEKTERILAEIVNAHEMVLGSPEPLIKLHTLGESSINFVVRPWTNTSDYWDVYWDITREVKLRFDREGISIPFPQRDVHLFTEDSAEAS